MARQTFMERFNDYTRTLSEEAKLPAGEVAVLLGLDPLFALDAAVRTLLGAAVEVPERLHDKLRRAGIRFDGSRSRSAKDAKKTAQKQK